MRAAGVIENVSTARDHDHVCFAFTDVTELQAAALSFLAQGLAMGQLVQLVIGEPGECKQWRRHEVLGPALRDGRAEIRTTRSLYPRDGVVDPRRQVAAHRAATDRAVADGFTGLRIAADVTDLLLSSAAADAFADYEYLVDRYIASAPFAGLCGYHRGTVPRINCAHVACLHPSVNGPAATPFRLYTDDAGDSALAGYLDVGCLDLFVAAIERSWGPERPGHLVLDASGLEFIDHNSLRALDVAGRTRAGTVVLRTGRPHVHQLVDLLELPAVHVEVVA